MGHDHPVAVGDDATVGDDGDQRNAVVFGPGLVKIVLDDLQPDKAAKQQAESQQDADGAVLGQHCFAYVLLAYTASALSRRILWFPLVQQALQVLPLLVATQIVQALMRLAVGADFPGWGYFIGPVVATLLWIPATFILLLPQYRPVEQDPNRPI